MMKAYDLLLTRQSSGLLTDPAPNSDDLDFILRAGMRAPDHGNLTPWHFTLVQQDGLAKLSALFVRATADESKHEKVKAMPYRAPLIIIVSCRYQAHDKVPAYEQLIASGCAVHAMQMAAYSLGYGAIWRTGELAENNIVKAGLSLQADDEIVGFLYIGSNQKVLPIKPEKSYQNKVSYL